MKTPFATTVVAAFIVTLILLLPLEGFADSHSPTPFCAEPTKPLLLSPAHYKDRYNTDILTYKSCLMDFIAEQDKAVILHKNAAEHARQIWNEFVKKGG